MKSSGKRSRSRVFAFAIVGVILATLADVGATAMRPSLPALYSDLEKTDTITQGSTTPKRTLYVFFDANCWYCHLTWKALQHYEKAGLQVRWVPVAYQKESSVTKAVAIMQATDRVAAMRENETGYNATTYDGAIAPSKNVPKDLAAQFAKNTKLMQDFGAPGTPLLVWKDEKGIIKTKVGMPRLSQLPQITGLPKQKINDPELADFR